MKGMKKLLGVIGVLALVAALVPAQGYAAFRGSFAPVAVPAAGGVSINGAEQPAVRPIDADGIMAVGVDGRLQELWFSYTSRSLVPGHEGVRSIYLYYNADLIGYLAPLLNDPAAEISYFDPAWSYDGRFLAYVQANRDGSGQALYVQEYFVNDDFTTDIPGGVYPPGQGAESPVGSPILVASGNIRHPDWDPNQHRLAFDWTIAGSPDIYTIDVDVVNGTAQGLARRTFDDVRAEVSPAWSPNGHEIVYSTNKFGPNQLEIIDLNLASTAPGYARLAEVNFANVSHNNPDFTADGGTLLYDAPSGEDPNGLTTIWKINLTTQGKCEMNVDPLIADNDPTSSNLMSQSNDHIPFSYFYFTTASTYGLGTWRANQLTSCELPLKMGVATRPSVMDLNDETTTTFQTISNFPPETRDVGYACFFASPYQGQVVPVHGSPTGTFGSPSGKDSMKPRRSVVISPTLMGLTPPFSQEILDATGSNVYPDCYDSLSRGLTDSLRVVCNWDFRTIADRIVALGLVDKIVPMKMTMYSNLTGRPVQGFAYVKLTQSSLPAAGVALLGNSPNPFNPVTKIRFAVSKPGTYTLRLYNVQGALVKTVASRHYDAGTHEATWDGRTTSGGMAASGVYYAKISGARNEASAGIKMVLAK
jgi:Tol biopolymer transport system component